MDAITAHTAALRSLDEDMAFFDQAAEHTDTRLARLSNKLDTAIDALTLNVADNADPKLLQAQMAVVKTAAQLEMARLNAARARVDVKQKRQDGETQANANQAVAELLRDLARRGGARPATAPLDVAGAQDSVAQRFTSSGERILDTELRADPTDLT